MNPQGQKTMSVFETSMDIFQPLQYKGQSFLLVCPLTDCYKRRIHEDDHW